MKIYEGVEGVEPDEARKDRLIKKMNTLAITDAVRMEKLRKH